MFFLRQIKSNKNYEFTDARIVLKNLALLLFINYHCLTLRKKEWNGRHFELLRIKIHFSQFLVDNFSKSEWLHFRMIVVTFQKDNFRDVFKTNFTTKKAKKGESDQTKNVKNKFSPIPNCSCPPPYYDLWKILSQNWQNLCIKQK